MNFKVKANFLGSEFNHTACIKYKLKDMTNEEDAIQWVHDSLNAQGFSPVDYKLTVKKWN